MTGDTVGGVWTFTLELAEALGEYGIEVALAAMGGEPSDAQREEAERIPNLRLFSRPYKLEWMSDPWRDIEAAGNWLRELEARIAPDLVHLNTFGHATLDWSAPVVLSAHSCVVSWWRAVHGEAPPPEWHRYRSLVRDALAAAEIVTAPSQSMMRSIEENYGTVARGAVIPNGRNPALFQAARKEPFILTVGRLWDSGKNIEMLATVAGSLPWPVYVAGEQRHPDGRAAELGACRPLGPLGASALREWYSRAAIYALPARYEPFGLSVLEAALSGCTLVLGDIDSLRENWDGAAIFAPPGDSDAWKSVLCRLASDDAGRRRLAERATRRASEFTPQRMACAYAECYSQAVRQREGVCAS
jgi:glycosyltransferase involved in cell wall biosynthesis